MPCAQTLTKGDKPWGSGVSEVLQRALGDSLSRVSGSTLRCGFGGSYSAEHSAASAGCSWCSAANAHFCLSRWSGARRRNQAAEVYLHTGPVSAEAQRDQEPPAEPPPAADHFLWERHGQGRHRASQAEVRELQRLPSPRHGLGDRGDWQGWRPSVPGLSWLPEGLWEGWLWAGQPGGDGTGWIPASLGEDRSSEARP